MRLRYLIDERFVKAEAPALILLVLLLLTCQWASGRIWLRFDENKVFINSRSLSAGSDYSIFRSLNGDIFCSHQDHGAQCLISPAKNEVSVISQSEDVTWLDIVLLSDNALTDLEYGSARKKLPAPNLLFENGTVEFTGIYGERWRILN